MPGSLNGVRVVSLALNIPGPLAAARLASLGASVTKVEPPTGDPLAAIAPDWYAELVADQQILALDLKNEADREKLDVELTGADVLLTAMRPSALCRLGLGDAPGRYPGLSHVEIVGYDGDLEERPGHDLTYQASHGTLQPPAMPRVPVADLLGSERAVSTALSALYAARRRRRSAPTDCVGGRGGRRRCGSAARAHRPRRPARWSDAYLWHLRQS